MDKVVACIFGTRPEAIKMAPVVEALRSTPGVRPLVMVTAQHRGMLDQVLDTFSLRPDVDLDIMLPGQDLAGLTARLFTALGDALARTSPDAVLVHGDTTSTMVGALSAFYRRIPVGHVEAGLRTGNLAAPFPEEMNRSVVACVARWNFAPTERARANLLAEGRAPGGILVTGNTVVDALHRVRSLLAQRGEAACLSALAAEAGPGAAACITALETARRVVLVTGHRRENFGQPLRDAFGALATVARAHPDVVLVYPVHLNPNVQEPAREILGGVDNVFLLPPLSYVPFTWLLQRAHVVVTDSGGIQEEAAVLGKPTLVTRDVTERPEVLDAGTAQLVGTSPERLVAALGRLLDEPAHHASMAAPSPVFGDGRAAERIAARVAADLGVA